MTNLQHELESLKRRQSDLEDQELELMERLEVAETALADGAAGLEQARADRERAEQLRDDALADIADGTKRHEAARAEVAGGHLRAAADPLRPDPHPDRHAPVRRCSRRAPCQGCRLELYGNELAAVRNADPHEVVRCENCGRILVRTAESGPVTRAASAHRRGGRRIARATRARPATARWCGTPTPGGCWPSGRRPSAGRPTTSRSTAAWSPACRRRWTSTRPPRSRCGWTPSSSSSRCRAAGRSSTPTCSQLALQAQKIARQLGQVRYTWVPRAQNGAADALANSAMDGKPVHRDPAAEAVVLEDDVQPTAEPAPVVTTVTHLLRHGQTEHTPERRYSGRNELPLSLTGRAEAEAAAVRAAGLGVEVVVASPLRRTRETAEIVAGRARACRSTFDKDLVELDFGDLEGLTFDEAAAKHPLAARRFMSDISVAAPGGESIADVGTRVARARRRILSEHAGRTVLVVSHVTPIKLLPGRRPRGRATRWCTGCSWRPRRCARSRGRRTAVPRCALVNDTSHLR